MGLCYVCGKEVEMPHRCPYCNLTYYDDHHLPEQHDCLRSPKRNWKTYRKIQKARGDINPRRGRGLIESIKKLPFILQKLGFCSEKKSGIVVNKLE